MSYGLVLINMYLCMLPLMLNYLFLHCLFAFLDLVATVAREIPVPAHDIHPLQRTNHPVHSRRP